MNSKFFSFAILICAAIWTSGCGTVAKLAGVNDKCVVIAKLAQVRSSNAVVALDLIEVKRGTTLEVVGEDTVENEKWYNVRAYDENNTEGWIEARNVLPDKLLRQSQTLADESKDIPTQATGQMRAATNLRLKPDRNDDNNILQRLKGGDTFDVIGWQRVAKPNDDADDLKDDKQKGAANNQPQSKRQTEKAPELLLDEKYDTWYKVRMRPDISPAPVGWVYGKQVELTVPADIIFYRTGLEFVAWSRIDGDFDISANAAATSQNLKDAGAKESKPGSWVILERSNKIEDPNGTDEPDFDHVLIMGYDKYSQDHYKVYLSGRVQGYLPLRVKGAGDSREFTVSLKDASGQKHDVTFSTFKDARSLLKVNVPPDIPKPDKNDY